MSIVCYVSAQALFVSFPVAAHFKGVISGKDYFATCPLSSIGYPLVRQSLLIHPKLYVHADCLLFVGTSTLCICLDYYALIAMNVLLICIQALWA